MARSVHQQDSDVYASVKQESESFQKDNVRYGLEGDAARRSRKVPCCEIQRTAHEHSVYECIRVHHTSRRVAPLDYVSDGPRIPVYALEAYTAPPNVQQASRPIPPAGHVLKPRHTPSMPFSHMGIYSSEEVLGLAASDRYSQRFDLKRAAYSDEGYTSRGCLYPTRSDSPHANESSGDSLRIHSWAASVEVHVSTGPPDAPLSESAVPPEASYPPSLGSLERPYRVLEDVTPDQTILAVGFKRCSECSVSYRITDGKRCICTSSDGDGDRPT